MSPWLASQGVQFQILFASVEVKCRCADELGSSCLATKHTLCVLGLYCGDVRARYFSRPCLRSVAQVAWRGGSMAAMGCLEARKTERSRDPVRHRKKNWNSTRCGGRDVCAAFESVLGPGRAGCRSPHAPGPMGSRMRRTASESSPAVPREASCSRSTDSLGGPPSWSRDDRSAPLLETQLWGDRLARDCRKEKV